MCGFRPSIRSFQLLGAAEFLTVPGEWVPASTPAVGARCHSGSLLSWPRIQKGHRMSYLVEAEGGWVGPVGVPEGSQLVPAFC